MDCRILLKFGKLGSLRIPEAAQSLKSTYFKIQYGGWPPNLCCLDHYNSAADFSISLTVGAEFERITADKLQTLKLRRSKVK